MRIFSGAIFTETNSFSPIPTSLESFRQGLLYEGPADTAPALGVLGSPWLAWRDLARARGFDFELGLVAFAEPSGLTTRTALAALADRLIESLARAAPVDIVLLALHGAMMADGCDDVEGDLVGRVREAVGPDVTVAVLIDPHAHLGAQMLRDADLVAAFQEWPHTDVETRAAHVFDLAVRCREGSVVPVAGVFDCRMVSAFPTAAQPMRGLVDHMRALEADASGILSASVIHGFPWGDSADVGTRMLIWSDADAELAQATAETLGRRLFDLRESVSFHTDLTLDEAIAYVRSATAGLIVLCDAGDNVPAGGAGDSTFFLRSALESNTGDICFGPIWDPMATAICFEAGEGALMPLRIGGKSGPAAGQPVDVLARVRKLLPAGSDGLSSRFGDRAWISVEPDLDLVLHARRATTASIEAVTDLGLDPRTRKAFVGKMLMHGAAAFAPIAAEVLSVATPGVLQMTYASIPLTKRRTPWWPKCADPFGAA